MGIRSEDKGVDSGLGWGPRREWSQGARRSRKAEIKRQETKSGGTDDLGGLESDVGTWVSSGVSGVCLFGRVPVTWRIYILTGGRGGVTQGVN